MKKKRIIVIEEDDERLKKIHFLLRLSGYEGHSSANLHEAVNWARVCHQAGEEVLSLLLNNVSSAEEGLTLLQELSDVSFSLPVIIVRRGDWDGTLPIARFPTLRILCCPPATVNAALTAIEQSRPLQTPPSRQVTA